MAAGRMESRASESRPTIRLPVLRHVDGGVGVASHRTQVPPLLGHAPPRVRRQKPRALLAADLARELDQRLRVARLGRRILITGRRPHDRRAEGRRRPRAPVRPPLDGGDAPEVEIPARPRIHSLPRALQLLRRLLGQPPSTWTTPSST